MKWKKYFKYILYLLKKKKQNIFLYLYNQAINALNNIQLIYEPNIFACFRISIL